MSVSNSSSEGRVIDERYELTASLGHGAAGTVWRGYDHEIQRPVAIKEIALTAASEDERAESRQRLLRELRAAGRVHHPATVTVFDVLRQEDTAYIVMELVDAPTLAQLLKVGPVPVERAARIALDILGALEETHRADLVHRDVKPSNIMVPVDGTAKLADFGIVHLMQDSRLTRTDMILGSPAYLAPEQVSHGPITPTTDLCQLGVTLYAMLEGHSPFDRERADHTCLAALSYVPEPPSCGGPLASLVSALLDKDPARRPDAAAVRSVLLRYASPSGRQSSGIRRVGGRGGASRARALVAVGIAVVAVATTATWALWPSQPSARPAAPSQAAPPRVLRWDTVRGADEIDRESVNLSDVDFAVQGCANGKLQRATEPQEMPCKVDHHIEFFSSFRYPRPYGSSYPNPAVLDRTAISFCQQRFRDYQRLPWVRDVAVTLTVVPPSPNRWNAETNYHNVVYCAATRTDGRTFHHSDLRRY